MAISAVEVMNFLAIYDEDIELEDNKIKIVNPDFNKTRMLGEVSIYRIISEIFKFFISKYNSKDEKVLDDGVDISEFILYLWGEDAKKFGERGFSNFCKYSKNEISLKMRHIEVSRDKIKMKFSGKFTKKIFTEYAQKLVQQPPVTGATSGEAVLKSEELGKDDV